MLGEVATAARTFAATLAGIPLSASPTAAASSRPDEEGDAGATRRASATRSHEPSRGTKRFSVSPSFSPLALSLSLFRSAHALSRVAPKRATSSSSSVSSFSSFFSTTTYTIATTSGSTRSLLLLSLSVRGSFPFSPRALSRESGSSARIPGRPSVLTRARTGHAHEGTSRPRVPTCAR